MITKTKKYQDPSANHSNSKIPSFKLFPRTDSRRPPFSSDPVQNKKLTNLMKIKFCSTGANYRQKLSFGKLSRASMFSTDCFVKVKQFQG